MHMYQEGRRRYQDETEMDSISFYRVIGLVELGHWSVKGLSAAQAIDTVQWLSKLLIKCLIESLSAPQGIEERK